MSKNLFDAYKNSIVFENREMKELNLCKQMSMTPTDKNLPLCLMFGKWFIYGLLHSKAEEFNLDTLSKVRQGFLKSYFEKDNKDYPNILFDYQDLMSKNNIFDAYNHYLFQMGG